MRDGNFNTSAISLALIFRFSLPMRDGNSTSSLSPLLCDEVLAYL